MSKKNFTKATTDVVNKFFSEFSEQNTDFEGYNQAILENTDVTNIEKKANIHKQSNNTKHTNVTNKSKHYDERGKRAERYGLLLDKQLKDDLKHLSNATGSKSVNDFIVTVLLEYVERPDNQSKLQKYKDILGE